MSPMMLYGLVFAVTTAFVGLIMYFFRDKSEGPRASERLDQVVGAKRSATESSADMLLKQALTDIDRKTLMDKLTPSFFRVSKTFEQADANIRPSALFGISVAFGVVGGVVSATTAGIYVAPFGALMLFSLPWVWLYRKRAGRLKAFEKQLGDALELVARALRAGHSLAAGMHVVAEEMPEPVSKEFGRVYEEQNLGIPIEDALNDMCERIPNLDLKFFVTSVAIQRQTGGDLAEILDRIGHIIRERHKILGQVKALTAEGRLSGLVLIALPIGLFFLMLHMRPEYIEALWKEDLGIKMSVAALVLMVIGAYSIKKIVDIKV